MAIPGSRLSAVNENAVNNEGRYVLYWMIAARRVRFNFALEHAADWARKLGVPLVILEPLRVDYPWACDRFHRFIIDGMADTALQVRNHNLTYYPYVEPEPGAGRGLLKAFSKNASVVVTDDYPAFFLRSMVSSAGMKLERRLEAVDGNGILPMSVADREFATAYAFRRFLQKTLPDYLDDMPLQDPLAEALPVPLPVPDRIVERWPQASSKMLKGKAEDLQALPINHNIDPTPLRGGSTVAEATLHNFLDSKLKTYLDTRNRPEENGSSGLSPYLHFGHLSSHQIFVELMTRSRWTPEDLSARTNGRRSGWWGVDEPAEAFLDQFITWRELGFNFCFHRSDHDDYSALPDWARQTLEYHALDDREFTYSEEEFAAASTHDPLWNAAQRQLLREGRIHNYLRMLWGKKILDWSEHPRQALAIMFELNNRYALDGRDPNSSSGILWTLGRFDRPWGPERPVFGKVRYMSSANTARKMPVGKYLEEFGPDSGGQR